MLTLEALKAAIPGALARTELAGLGPREEGKVRDIYRVGARRVLVTTDRISAFDRVLGTIPYKGQVLNQLSQWWFGQLADVVSNHMESVPDPNVTIAREAQPLPVEVIVRAYITGSTSTSLWTLYAAGQDPYGLSLPPGLQKHQALPHPVITPTTKAARGEHDEALSAAEVSARGLVSPALWAQVQEAALAIFARGQEVAARAGLLLVDTKYEFGLIDGALCLIDEVHTPDSSRYWSADSYDDAMRRGAPIEQFDKEHLRLWLGAQGYKGEGPPPALDPQVVAETAARYIETFERLTGQTFDPAPLPAADRIAQSQASGWSL